MEGPLIVPVFLLSMAGAVWVGIRRSRQARAILEEWAEGEGQQLVEARRAWLWIGPFWSCTGSGHAVFRLRLSSSDGAKRAGWARVGNWWDTFRVTPTVKVRLDDGEPEVAA